MNKILLLLLGIVAGLQTKAQIPSLSSYPSSPYVLYLDFDGEVVNNVNWSDSTINAAPANLTAAQITEIFYRVSEKYRPFNINVTTSLSVYNAASATKRLHSVITPTYQWYGVAVGGVTYVGSFGYVSYDPSWVFSSNLSNNPEFIADAIVHEAGHAFGLQHHGQFNSACQKLSNYNPGKGSGQASWGPIMGAPYGMNEVLWYSGATTGSTCAGGYQDDLSIITTNNGFGYRADDKGNTINTAYALNLVSNTFSDSGTIEQYTDIDMFSFKVTQSSAVTVNARPYSIIPATNEGASLDIRMELYNSAGQLLGIDTSLTRLNTTITMGSLPAGTYYFAIKSGGNPNYTDNGGQGPLNYGSMGKYYVTGSITGSASGPPHAVFTPSASTVCAGQTITFTDNSTNNPTSWSWQSKGASNPNVSTQNATFTFPLSGTYNVRLLVSNSYGSDSTVQQVTINAGPAVNVSGGTSLCLGGSINLSVTGGNTYSWSPATGLNQTTGSSVVASPVVNTTYTVTGTGTNGCTSSLSTVLNVTNVALAVSNNTAVCKGNSASLVAAGATTYTWAPATGLNQTTGANSTASPSVTTTYTITGNTNGCTATKTIAVTINQLPVISASGTNTICSGNNTSLTAGGGSTYTWSPSTGLSQTTGINVTAAPSSNITYTITGSNGTCLNTFTYPVTVNPLPNITTSLNSALCLGSNTTLTASGGTSYTWSPALGLNQTTGASIIATPLVTTTYTVTGSSGLCSVSKTVALTVSAGVNVTLNTTSTNICQGSGASLIASGGTTYSWLPVAGLNLLTGASVTASPSVTTTYTVTGVSGTCIGVSQVVVNVTATPVLTLTPNSSVCNGSSLALSGSGATSYSWSPASGLNQTTGTSVTAKPSVTTTYTLTGTNGTCSASKTVVLTVSSAANVSINTGSTNICKGNATSLTATGAATYTWTPTLGLSISTGASVTAAPTATTTYSVTGVAGSCSGSSQVVINVIPLPVLSSTSNSTMCSGSSLNLTASGATTYTWSPATGLAQTSGTGVTAFPSSSITYTITGVTNNCSSQKTISVTVNPLPNVTVSASSTVCAGSSAIVSANGATNYSWSPATGLTSTTASAIIATPASTTTYSVTGISNGCSKSGTVTVTVNPLPVVSVSNTGTSLCAGSSTSLTSSGATTYTWSPSTALNLTTGASVTASPTVSTTYTTTGTLNGCSRTITTVLNVSPAFTLNSTANSAVCNGTSITLNGTGAASYTWSPVTGLNQTTGANVTATPSATIIYTITGTTGYCSKTKTVVITDNPKPSLSSVITQAGCGGQPVGAVNLTVGNISSGLNYLWSNAKTTQSISSVAAGSYIVTVTSSTGCVSTLANNVTAAACSQPGNVTAQNISITTATIAWSRTSCAASYAVRYRVSGATTWTNASIISADSTYSIAGLAAATIYEYQVQSYCNAQKTDSSGYTASKTFASAAACVIPGNFVTSSITSTAATLSWTAVPGVWGYVVEYRRSDNSTAWASFTVQAPTTSYILTGLTLSTNYKWQVRSQCDAAGQNLSGWSTSIYFETFSSGRMEVFGDSVSTFSIETYPNPTSGMLHVVFESEANQPIQLKIFNLEGQQMMSDEQTMSEEVTDKVIDISTYPAGMYIVRATDGKNLWVQKVIKQ